MNDAKFSKEVKVIHQNMCARDSDNRMYIKDSPFYQLLTFQRKNA